MKSLRSFSSNVCSCYFTSCLKWLSAISMFASKFLIRHGSPGIYLTKGSTVATNMTFSFVRFWFTESKSLQKSRSPWSYRLPKLMEHMMLEIQTLSKLCTLNGCPFFEWISWTNASNSSIILDSKLRFPNPNSLRAFRVKVLCSFHSAPEALAIPKIRINWYIKINIKRK